MTEKTYFKVTPKMLSVVIGTGATIGSITGHYVAESSNLESLTATAAGALIGAAATTLVYLESRYNKPINYQETNKQN